MNFIIKKRKRDTAGFFGPNRPPVHPFTLSFGIPELKSEFETFSTERSLSFVRVSLVLAIFLYGIFAALDLFFVEGSPKDAMIVRAFSCLLFVASIFLTYTRWGVSNFQFLMSLTVFIGGMGIIAMTLMFESIGWYSYYPGIILAVIYAHVLLRMRFIYASVTTWAVILIYLAATIGLRVTPYEVYMNNIAFLISTNIMGMFASYWLEYYMKAVFWNTRLLEQKSAELTREDERKSRELEAARRLQLNLLPKSSPHLINYEFHFSMRPATEIGGDYFDYLFDDTDTLIFSIGDATGHGAQAGVLVTAIKMLFTDLATNLDLIDFLKRASRSISLMGFRKLFMAFAIGRLKEDRVEIAGAGMPPGLIYRADTKKIEPVELKGMPLGSKVEYPYRKTAFTLGPGDSLLLMSDGLPELQNREGEMFGYQRIETVLASGAESSPDRVIEELNYRKNEWLDGYPQNDDITFFMIKRKPVAKPRPAIRKRVPAL
ncbi:MAG: SpoIIE family protein phosphatase [Balneolaceae bacterium]|nr:SpoIIE family protein phosphatase [Balneolaceae bacterium]